MAHLRRLCCDGAIACSRRDVLFLQKEMVPDWPDRMFRHCEGGLDMLNMTLSRRIAFDPWPQQVTEAKHHPRFFLHLDPQI